MNKKIIINFKKNLLDIVIILTLTIVLPKSVEAILGINSRYIVNLDFLLILLFVSGSLLVLPVIYGLYLIIYFILIIFESHYFFNISELIFSIKELTSYQKNKTFLVVVFFPVIIFAVFILNKYIVERNKNIKYKIAYISLILIVLDAANGSNRLNLEIAFKYTSNILSSSVVRLIDQQLHRNTAPPDITNHFIESATSKYTGWNSSDKKNIVLIIVESMSTFKDDKVFEYIYGDLFKNNNNFQISTGFIPKGYGSTPGGEYREICQTKASHFYNDHVDYLSCLPNFLNLNYDSISFHGTSKYIFNRNKYYEKMGFKKSLFLEQLSNLEKCDGSFPGVCDLSLIMSIQQLLKESVTPKFIYFLTLSSHLPVSRMLSTQENKVCFELSIRQEACPYLFRIKDIIKGIEILLNTESVLATDFIIVGDHPAPLLNSSISGMIDANNVPYFIFQNNNLRR
jgi:phosphoglycerol transferase MdoB-like AlkP superfamily enzyme